MPPVIRHLFSLLLVGVVALNLLGAASPASFCADADCGEALYIHSDGDTDSGAGGDMPAAAGATAAPLPTTHAITAANVPSLWAAYPVHPGHWPQAPPA